MNNYFITHDKSMITCKNLTPSLHFLPFFNDNQMLFVACFFFLHKFFVDTILINSIEGCHACLNIIKVGKGFLNTWTKSYHIFMFMDTIK